MKNLSFEPQATFKKSWGNHQLELLAGGSIQSRETRQQEIVADGYKSDALLRNFASATSYRLNNSLVQYKYAAAFGRATYNYADKYILNLTARRDGSSRFGPGNQFGNFGSVGAAWLFSREDFVSRLVSALSYGKLRFSYGTSGNDGISDYAYFESYNAIEASDPYLGVRGYETSGLFNPYYAWETTHKMELGLETGWIDDKFLLSISVFRNRSDNQLVGYPYPSISGPGFVVVNSPALIQNTGIELSSTAQIIKNKTFFWSSSFNFSAHRNKLIDFPGLEASAYYGTFEIGKPFTGVDKVFNYAGVDPQTGLYLFKKIDGTVQSDPNDPQQVDNGHYMRISRDPQFFGGMSHTLSYKNISLDLFFQFVKQTGKNYLREYIVAPAGFMAANLPEEFLNRWQKTGDNTGVQKVEGVFSDDYYSNADRWAQSSGAYVDASFVRLKNCSLSWTMPEKINQSLRLQRLRVFLQGQNLFTLTKYKGLDPETQSLSTLPPLRVMTFGFQITL
jgi:hypothetical protein